MSNHGERTFSEWVWCCHWYRCGGIGDPGYTGGGEVMLCTACEANRLESLDRLARAGELPPTPQQDEANGSHRHEERGGSGGEREGYAGALAGQRAALDHDSAVRGCDGEGSEAD